MSEHVPQEPSAESRSLDVALRHPCLQQLGAILNKAVREVQHLRALERGAAEVGPPVRPFEHRVLTVVGWQHANALDYLLTVLADYRFDSATVERARAEVARLRLLQAQRVADRVADRERQP